MTERKKASERASALLSLALLVRHKTQTKLNNPTKTQSQKKKDFFWKNHATAKPRQRARSRSRRKPCSDDCAFPPACLKDFRRHGGRASRARKPPDRGASCANQDSGPRPRAGGRAGGGSHRPTVRNDRPDAGSNHVPVTGTYLPMVPVILAYTKDFWCKQRAQICKITTQKKKKKTKLPDFYDKFE